jgi:tetratricopeptide (TPR) repeat protein
VTDRAMRLARPKRRRNPLVLPAGFPYHLAVFWPGNFCEPLMTAHQLDRDHPPGVRGSLRHCKSHSLTWPRRVAARSLLGSRFVLGWLWTVFLLGAAGCRMMNGASSEEAAASRQLTVRGKSALERGDVRAAEALLAEAIKCCPDDPAARRHYAEALWQRSAKDDALLQAEEALRLAGDDPAIAVQAGQMNLAMGRMDEALRLANFALNSNPRFAAAWALRGRVAARTGSLDDALADFHRSLSHAPGDPEVLFETAEVYRALGQPKQALSTLSSISAPLDCQEERMQVLYLRGLALAALDRHADAADAYLLALARNSPSAEIWARLADAQLRIGQVDAAEYAAGQALSMDPNHRMARAVRDQLSGESLARRGD